MIAVKIFIYLIILEIIAAAVFLMLWLIKDALKTIFDPNKNGLMKTAVDTLQEICDFMLYLLYLLLVLIGIAFVIICAAGLIWAMIQMITDI